MPYLQTYYLSVSQAPSRELVAEFLRTLPFKNILLPFLPIQDFSEKQLSDNIK